MSKRGVLLVLDSAMLLFFVVLEAWRVSGIIAHEWIGLAIIAMILVHLLVHWGWVESTVRSTVKKPRRSRTIPLALNVALFAAMGLALISGIVISKVVFPNRLTPSGYLQWHELHELGSNLSLVLIGLHIALNWDRILSSIRTGFNKAGGRIRLLSPAVLTRRLAWILVVSAALTGAVELKMKLAPSKAEVIRVYANGRRERTGPPPGIEKIRNGTEGPDFGIGGPRFVLDALILVALAVAGRKLLRLRLTSRREEKHTMPKVA